MRCYVFVLLKGQISVLSKKGKKVQMVLKSHGLLCTDSILNKNDPEALNAKEM